MSTYAIGDLQGCYDELQTLLDKINFDENRDHLWFTGDLVNRGPGSLETLRFVMELGEKATTVLGNHDLHLLAVANGVRAPRRKDTFDAILNDTNKERYLAWIRCQPLMVHDEKSGFCLLHAGVFPRWSMDQAMELAAETSELLASDQFSDFLQVIYGNEPSAWSNDLQGFDRARCIINALTRMRYLDKNGEMNFEEKGPPGSQTNGLIPWYMHPDRVTTKQNIIFGHWSTVTLGSDKDFSPYNVYPLDTGCVWGGSLTALRLEDEKLFSVPAGKPA